MRLPPEDLVQLEEDAGRGLVVGEVVVFDAGPPGTDVHVADLPGWGWQLEVAVVDVLTGTSAFAVAFVCCKK